MLTKTKTETETEIKPSKKAHAIRLTLQQKYAIGEYCAQNGAVHTDDKGLFTRYRMTKQAIADEVSEKLFKINSYHLDDCLNIFNWVNAKNDIKIEIKPEQETVQIEMLKIEIEKLKNAVDQKQSNYENLLDVVKNLTDKLNSISKFSIHYHQEIMRQTKL